MLVTNCKTNRNIYILIYTDCNILLGFLKSISIFLFYYSFTIYTSFLNKQLKASTLNICSLEKVDCGSREKNISIIRTQHIDMAGEVFRCSPYKNHCRKININEDRKWSKKEEREREENFLKKNSLKEVCGVKPMGCDEKII